MPPYVLRRLQHHLHAVIRQHRAGRAPFLRLPEIEPLFELDREEVCFEVPGMYGGFRYRLADDDIVPRLLVEAFCRVVEGSLHYEVTPSGWRRLGRSDGPGPHRRPLGRRRAGSASRAARPAPAGDGASGPWHSRAHRAGISCRKQHLAFVMDMEEIPWSWDTSEAVLEERLRNCNEEAYLQFLRDREEA